MTTRTFADRFNFALRHRPEWVQQQRAISSERIAALRSGAAQPSDDELHQISSGVQVPMAYWHDDSVAAIADAVMVLGTSLRNREVELIGPCRQPVPSPRTQLAVYCAVLSGIEKRGRAGE